MFWRRQMQSGDLRVGGAPEIAPLMLAVFEALKDEKSLAGGNNISRSQAGIVHGALIGQFLFFIRRFDLGRTRLRLCDEFRGSGPRILDALTPLLFSQRCVGGTLRNPVSLPVPMVAWAKASTSKSPA